MTDTPRIHSPGEALLPDDAASGVRRRTLLGAAAAWSGLGGVAGLAACADAPSSSTTPDAGAPPSATTTKPSASARGSTPRVVVVGGGYGGATVAKYLRRWSDHRIEVILVEPEVAFVSCPLSNLVLGGTETLAGLTVSYTALVERHGVQVVRDRVTAVDVQRRTVQLFSGPTTVRYDRLVLSPGVELMWDKVAGLRQAHDAGAVLQAWQAGPETDALRRQLVAMPDGGTYAITIPEAPYRCPPGPYERACQVASYFKAAKPRSKVLILDANADVVSKGALFKRAWAELYPGLVEYRSHYNAVAVDAGVGAAKRTVRFEVQDDVQADVLNVLPPMRAGAIAVRSGLANSNGRWCSVDFLDFQSTVAQGVHVLGDAIQTAPNMPKSGHMANGHAKVCAAALIAELAGGAADPAPMLTNTCYSHVGAESAIHVTSVHRYDAVERTYKTVAGSGGVSEVASAAEAVEGSAWARGIWGDMLG